MSRTPASVAVGQKPTAHTPLHSSCEHPNRNRLHVQLPSPNSFRRLAEDVSKLPKFLSVLSALRQRQQFVVPIDVQVLFVIGLQSRQNSSAFVHLAVAPTYLHLVLIFMVRCGSQNHDLFVAEGFDGVEAGGLPGGVDAENDADEGAHDERKGNPEQGQEGGHLQDVTHQQG